MSEFLFLARDYIERMANPVYGSPTNEDYAIRFATLLRSEGFEARLNEEVSTLTDRATLTSYGWLWLLGWARAKNLKLKEDLLVALYDEWSSVFVRAIIVDLATQDVAYQQNFETVSLENFGNPFLSRIMSQAVRGLEVKRPREPQKEDRRMDEQRTKPIPSTAFAESTLIALLQVGTPVTVDAARVLLRQDWEGQEQLLQYFWAICDNLDSETREVWMNHLRPPRPNDQI